MYFPYLFHVETLDKCLHVKCPGSLLDGDGWCSPQLCPWRRDTDGHKAEFKTADLCLLVIVMVYL